MIIVPITELNDKWWIAYNNDNSVVHYGKTDAPQETETGLPLYQVFDTEESWLNELNTTFNIVTE